MLAETHRTEMVCHFHNHLQDLHLIPLSPWFPTLTAMGLTWSFQKTFVSAPTLPQTLIYLIHRGHAHCKPVPLMGTQAEMLQEETELERAKLGLLYSVPTGGHGFKLITPSCRVRKLSGLCFCLKFNNPKI